MRELVTLYSSSRGHSSNIFACESFYVAFIMNCFDSFD